MTDFYLWMCNLFVLVAYISEELNVVTRFGSCCCLIGFILSIFMMCESIVVYAERRCGHIRSENAGMSIEKKGENPFHRKPEGS